MNRSIGNPTGKRRPARAALATATSAHGHPFVASASRAGTWPARSMKMQAELVANGAHETVECSSRRRPRSQPRTAERVAPGHRWQSLFATAGRLAVMLGLCWGSLLFNPLDNVWGAEEIDTQRAFKSLSRAPWYDAESGGYAPPEIAPLSDNALRQEGWQAKLKPQNAGTNWNWQFGNWLSEAFSWFVLILLGALLTMVLILLIWHSVRNYLPARRGRMATQPGVNIDPARVVDLPFEVTHTSRDPLGEAERLMRAGRYDEAIVMLYGYMLLALDQSRLIHLQRGKTNRMYLRELKQRARLMRIIETTMLAFEDVFFGKHSISRERWEMVWQQLDEFHQQAAPAQSSAAPASTVEVATL